MVALSQSISLDWKYMVYVIQHNRVTLCTGLFELGVNNKELGLKPSLLPTSKSENQHRRYVRIELWPIKQIFIQIQCVPTSPPTCPSSETFKRIGWDSDLVAVLLNGWIWTENGLKVDWTWKIPPQSWLKVHKINYSVHFQVRFGKCSWTIK